MALATRFSDADKKARGTFDPRYSAAASAEKRMADVISLPNVHEIPPCPYKLDEQSQKFYGEVVRALHEVGALTVNKLELAATAALRKSMINKRIETGQNVPESMFKGLEIAIANLERVEADRAFVGSTVRRANRYSRNGFAASGK